MEYTPYYITERSDFKPGHVVTADEFNGWINRLAIQGDGNTDILVELVESANDYEERMDVAEDKLDSIEMSPVYEEGVNVGSFTFNNETVNIYAPVAGEVVQSDWEQTDTNAVDYIKNKPSIKSAEGSNSVAMGLATSASGSNNVAMGLATRASGHCQTVLGKYNVETNDLLIIGNGSLNANRSNALTVGSTGDVNYDNASRSLSKHLDGVSLYSEGTFLNNVVPADLAPDEKVDLLKVTRAVLNQFVPEAPMIVNLEPPSPSVTYKNANDLDYVRDLFSRRACLEVYIRDHLNGGPLNIPLNITSFEGTNYYVIIPALYDGSTERRINPGVFTSSGYGGNTYSTSTCVIPVASLSNVPYIFNVIGRFMFTLSSYELTLSFVSGAYATNCLTQDITTGAYTVGFPSLSGGYGALEIEDIRIKAGY